MLKLSDWRPRLLGWLQTYVTVDHWNLEHPEIGEVVGFLPPLRNLTYTVDEPGDTQATGVQDFFVSLRYPRDKRYHELPLATLEGAYQTLSILMLHRYGSLGITSCEAVALSDPLNVQETGPAPGEWLVTLRWTWDLLWYALPESTFLVPEDQPQEPYDLASIRTGVWRQALPGTTGDQATAVLDFTRLLE